MTDGNPRPHARPARTSFSSGPCLKPLGWSAAKLPHGALGRSHRAPIGKSRLKHAIDLTREILEVPVSHRIAIVPASDTGAVEMALWSLLGPRPVTVAAWESFGRGWITDVASQLKLDPVVLGADYGELPDLAAADPANDIVFTWNGTTSGVRVPDGEWIAEDRQGLTICDATSAAFAMPLPWDKLDVATFSWQKALGSEGAHGMLVLGPRAIERLESHKPAWPMPKIFRLVKPALSGVEGDGKLIEGVFAGDTINTPSMLAVEDYIWCLEWAKGLGGLDTLVARTEANAAALSAWVEASDWIDHAVADPAIRSTTSVCLNFAPDSVAALDEAARTALEKEIVRLLDIEAVAHDLGSYREAPPGLRIWCGPTVETSDIEALCPWLDWAWREAGASSC